MVHFKHPYNLKMSSMQHLYKLDDAVAQTSDDHSTNDNLVINYNLCIVIGKSVGVQVSLLVASVYHCNL